jgi:hypothetical protein
MTLDTPVLNKLTTLAYRCLFMHVNMIISYFLIVNTAYGDVVYREFYNKDIALLKLKAHPFAVKIICSDELPDDETINAFKAEAKTYL